MKTTIAILLFLTSKAFAITSAEQAKLVFDVGTTSPSSLLINISRDLRGGACTNVGMLSSAIETLKRDQAIATAAKKINPQSTQNMLSMEKSVGELMIGYCQTNKMNRGQALDLASDIANTASLE